MDCCVFHEELDVQRLYRVVKNNKWIK